MKMDEMAWVDLSPTNIAKASLFLGFTFGLSLFGFITVSWIKKWPNWKVPGFSNRKNHE